MECRFFVNAIHILHRFFEDTSIVGKKGLKLFVNCLIIDCDGYSRCSNINISGPSYIIQMFISFLIQVYFYFCFRRGNGNQLSMHWSLVGRRASFLLLGLFVGHTQCETKQRKFNSLRGTTFQR